MPRDEGERKGLARLRLAANRWRSLLRCRAEFLQLGIRGVDGLLSGLLLAACLNRSYLEAHGFGLDKYIEHPLVLEDGKALAPSRPGHGIGFDWNGLAKLAP